MKSVRILDHFVTPSASESTLYNLSHCMRHQIKEKQINIVQHETRKIEVWTQLSYVTNWPYC
jgi:hypothetical protein